MARRRKKVMGKCRICGKYGKLSFEHVPPQRAFNKATIVEYTLESWIAKRKVKGKYRQGGVGQHTLCEKCNSDTGSWYGDEYVKWTRIGFDILQHLDQHSEHFKDKTEILVTLKGVRPLRFLKQVVTCFLSVVGISPEAEFAQNNPELVKFVLDKQETYLPPGDRFYLTLNRLHRASVIRRHPIGGKLRVRIDKNGNIVPAEASVFSEIAHPPFGLVMTYGTGFPDATEITHFKNYKYDDMVDLNLGLAIGEASDPYPGSYQTRSTME